MTDQERIARLEREIETMLGIQAGMTAILTSLIAKHPNHEQLILHLVSVAEIMEAGSMGRALSPKQREVARSYVEHLQRIRAVRGDIRPLGK